MKYLSTHYAHGTPGKIGVLITNLGTPDEPTKPALKRYLKEFLSDPRVVEFPRPLWWMILNLVILNIRPAKSAKSYQTVWTDQGSPLLTITQEQAQRIQSDLGDNIAVEFAMRYGNPSIASRIESLLSQGVTKMLVLPLYPQYCAATSASTFDAVAHYLIKQRWQPDLRFISHYHDHRAYISACVRSIQSHWQKHGRAGHLLFSYHGIPKRYLKNGDPYFCECHKTTRLIANELNLPPDQYTMTFQSRFGREEWLQPYTDETLKQMPSQGITGVQVFCPGFAADCLETIEEINVENRNYFLEAGGETFDYIPALNCDPWHIDALVQIIHENLNGWRITNDELAIQKEAAQALGADT